jgi:hypothetical protein
MDVKVTELDVLVRLKLSLPFPDVVVEMQVLWRVVEFDPVSLEYLCLRGFPSQK